MKTPTIKPEGALLASLEWALRQEQLSVAAGRFVELMRGSPEEAEWLAEWERADLANAPVKKRIRR